MGEDGIGDGEIEALGEAMHRDVDAVVGLGDGFAGDASMLGAEDDGEWLIDRYIVWCVALVLDGGDGDLVAALAQFGEGGAGVIVGVDVTDLVDPLVGAFGDEAGHLHGGVGFHDVKLLQP